MTRKTMWGMLAFSTIVMSCAFLLSLPTTHVEAQAPQRATPKSLGGITNASQTVNGSGATLDAINCINPNAAVSYLQVFNTAGAVTVGTTVPTQSFAIPANGQLEHNPPYGAWYSAAIKVAGTTTRTGNTAPATAGLDCNFEIR